MFSWEFIQGVFLVLGGLGLFLYGMKIMSDGLTKIAGNRMRTILEKATKNRFVGVTIGTIVAFIIQSSTATTIMVVSFVNASMMSLKQSVGIIIGANIGTTLSTQILTFRIESIAPILIFAGFLMYVGVNKRKIKNTGMFILGLGILFFGMSVMGEPLKDFAQEPSFQAILTTFQNPLLALLAGMIFTGIIQSSTAAMGIIIALYLGGVDLPFATAAYLVLGVNVGTCFTVVLASLAANRDSKRAALIHVTYNVLGCVIFGILLAIFPGILIWFDNTWSDAAVKIAMFHTFYNLGCAVVLIGFVKQFVRLVNQILPRLPEEDLYAKKLMFLGPSVLDYPDTALAKGRLEIERMGRLSLENLSLALNAFYSRSSEKAAKVLDVEEVIDYYNDHITSWLVEIQFMKLPQEAHEEINHLLRIVSHVERIGDLAEGIAEIVILDEKYHPNFVKESVKDLRQLSDLVIEAIDLSVYSIVNRDKDNLKEIKRLERKIKSTSKILFRAHIRRLKDKACDPRGGIIFQDIIMSLERCANHALSIAYSLGERPNDIEEVKEALIKE